MNLLKTIILSLFLFVNLVYQVNGLSQSKYEITSSSYLTGGALINVTLKISNKPEFIKLAIGNIELTKTVDSFPKYTFQVPANTYFNPNNLEIKLTINNEEFKGNTWPWIISLPKETMEGDKEYKFESILSGECDLVVKTGTNIKIKLIKKSNTNVSDSYLALPNNLGGRYTGVYAECNGLKSNFLNFQISYPELYYLISKDKQNLQPGSRVTIKGYLFKEKDNDKASIMIDKTEIKDYLVLDNNTREFDLPNINLTNACIKIIRNGLESTNPICLNISNYPNIEDITTEQINGENMIKVIGKFNSKMGSQSLKLNNSNLIIFKTGDDTVYAKFPKITTSTNGFECSYYLERGYITLTQANIVSNNYFFQPNNMPYINNVVQPYCNNQGCYLKFNVDGLQNGKYKVLLNGQEKKVDSDLSSKLVIINTQNQLIKQGYLQIVRDDCTKSEEYYFNYTRENSPKISYLESEHSYLKGSSFKIYGDKMMSDGFSGDMAIKLSVSPDILTKDTKGNIIWAAKQNSIEAEIQGNATSGTKAVISVSNRNGDLNKGYFIVGKGKEYLGYPLLRNVLMPEGGSANKKLIIKGIGFSSRCAENEIFLGDQSLKPTLCELTTLEALLPEKSANNIAVKVNGNESNKLTLDSNIGGILSGESEIDFLSSNINTGFNMANNKEMVINFQIKNNTNNIIISKLEFLVDFVDNFPIGTATLAVDDNDTLYFYDTTNQSLIHTNNKNLGIISLINKNQLKITFTNIYLPYKAVPTNIKLKLEISRKSNSNTNLKIKLNSQKISYKIIGDSTNTNNSLTISNLELANYQVITNSIICFDTSKKQDINNCNNLLISGNNNIKKSVPIIESNKIPDAIKKDINIISEKNKTIANNYIIKLDALVEQKAKGSANKKKLLYQKIYNSLNNKYNQIKESEMKLVIKSILNLLESKTK